VGNAAVCNHSGTFLCVCFWCSLARITRILGVRSSDRSPGFCLLDLRDPCAAIRAAEVVPDASSFPEILVGFALGGALITAMWLLLWVVGLNNVQRGPWTHWFEDLVFDSYISAVLEELAFRAVLFRILARICGVRTGVILSSLLFGLAHLTHGSWLGILGITLNAGVTMALLYVITGRLWMSIGMHLGYDFIETSVLGVGNHHGFLVSTPNAGAQAWLSGGSFGPDAAVPGMIVGLIINFVLWRLAFGTSNVE